MKDFSSLSPLSIQTRQSCGIGDPCLVRRWCPCYLGLRKTSIEKEEMRGLVFFNLHHVKF